MVDPSLNTHFPKDLNDGSNNWAQVTFFSATLDKLPTIRSVGCILRVQRANVGYFKNQKQFTVNLRIGGNWAIYPSLLSHIRKVQEGEEESKNDE